MFCVLGDMDMPVWSTLDCDIFQIREGSYMGGHFCDEIRQENKVQGCMVKNIKTASCVYFFFKIIKQNTGYALCTNMWKVVAQENVIAWILYVISLYLSEIISHIV